MIKLSVEDYCQDCPCFKVDISSYGHRLGSAPVFEVVCASRGPCRLIRGYQKRKLEEEARNGSLPDAGKDS